MTVMSLPRHHEILLQELQKFVPRNFGLLENVVHISWRQVAGVSRNHCANSLHRPMMTAMARFSLSPAPIGDRPLDGVALSPAVLFLENSCAEAPQFESGTDSSANLF